LGSGIVRFEFFLAGLFALCPISAPNFHLGLGSLVHDSRFNFVLRPIVNPSHALGSLPRVIQFHPSSLQFCWAFLVLLVRSKGKRSANHCSSRLLSLALFSSDFDLIDLTLKIDQYRLLDSGN
jgi:hypothetical protein